MLSDSFCQIGFSGDVHVADQSTTSIVLAWTEPLVVGAAGLRGGPTAAGNRDVDFRIQKNTHYIRYHPTMLKDSLLLYCTFFFFRQTFGFFVVFNRFLPWSRKEVDIPETLDQPTARFGRWDKKNRRILDLRQREHHIDDSVAVPHWKRTTRTTGWHGWHRWRHQGDHSDDRFFSQWTWKLVIEFWAPYLFLQGSSSYVCYLNVRWPCVVVSFCWRYFSRTLGISKIRRSQVGSKHCIFW